MSPGSPSQPVVGPNNSDLSTLHSRDASPAASSDAQWPLDPLALPEDLKEKAERELGETPSVRQAALKELRGRVEALGEKERPHRTDEQYLLAFLRPQKFRVDKALQKLRAYTAFKQDHRGILVGMKAQDFRGMLEIGFLRPLPGRDQEGRAVICMFPEKLDPSKLAEPELLIKWTIFSLEQTGAMFDPYFQVNGVLIVEDLQDFTLIKMFKSMGGSMKKAQDANFKFMREACPYRLKGMLLVNEPIFMDIILAFVSPFMSSKLLGRISLLGRGTKGQAALHKLVAPECLPPEFGGTLEAEPLAKLDEFEEMEKQGQTFDVL